MNQCEKLLINNLKNDILPDSNVIIINIFDLKKNLINYILIAYRKNCYR